MSRRFDQLSGPHAIRSLFLARVDNAQAVLQRSAFQLRPEVEKILTFFEPLAEERAIAARVQGDATLNADRTMIQRMLGNLLSNALRHSPQGGAVLVRIRSNSDGSVELTVSNAGEPIAVEHLPRLFDRFYRVDAARSSSGAGLGLAIVKSIAELHGGYASVTSAAAEGTRFAIYLPPNPANDSAPPGGDRLLIGYLLSRWARLLARRRSCAAIATGKDGEGRLSCSLYRRRRAAAGDPATSPSTGRLGVALGPNPA